MVILLLLLIGVPVLELLAMIWVAEAIGVLPMLVALLAGSVIGVRVARSQGRAALRRFTAQVRANRPPAREALDGALIFAGGALLAVPGFITDVLGALLLMPPVRALAKALIVRHYGGRLIGLVVRRGPPASYDVDATAVELDQPQLPR
jgi:UPF0716 protein FxsA